MVTKTKCAIAVMALAALCGCVQNNQKTEGRMTTIDSALQVMVDSFITEEVELVDGEEAQVAVMEVATGSIKALVGLQRQSNGTVQRVENFAHQQEPGSLAKVATLLAAMETGRIHLSDSVDTGEGIWPFDGKLIRDHNWFRGGYGILTYEQALEFSSNVAICKALQEAFVMNVNKYLSMLDAMSFGQPDSIEGIVGLKSPVYSSPKDSNWINSRFIYHAIGYERQMAPIQTLTFYNAIANDGKMVKPTLYSGETEIINEQIASKKNIKEMQLALYHVVYQGLGKRAMCDKTTVAGKTGTAVLYEPTDDDKNEKTLYNMSFCGYFPADKPRYSIIVSINKKGLPASGGGMAGPVFSNIVNYMCENKY